MFLNEKNIFLIFVEYNKAVQFNKLKLKVYEPAILKVVGVEVLSSDENDNLHTTWARF